MALPLNSPLSDGRYSETFADISAASSVFFCIGGRGKIKEIRVSLNNAITGSDTGLTFKVNGTLGTGSATVAVSGSAAGSSFTIAPTAGHVVKPGDIVEVISDGVSSTTCIAPCCMTVDERTI